MVASNPLKPGPRPIFESPCPSKSWKSLAHGRASKSWKSPCASNKWKPNPPSNFFHFRIFQKLAIQPSSKKWNFAGSLSFHFLEFCRIVEFPFFGILPDHQEENTTSKNWQIVRIAALPFFGIIAGSETGRPTSIFWESSA